MTSLFTRACFLELKSPFLKSCLALIDFIQHSCQDVMHCRYYCVCDKISLWRHVMSFRYLLLFIFKTTILTSYAYLVMTDSFWKNCGFIIKFHTVNICGRWIFFWRAFFLLLGVRVHEKLLHVSHNVTFCRSFCRGRGEWLE